MHRTLRGIHFNSSSSPSYALQSLLPPAIKFRLTPTGRLAAPASFHTTAYANMAQRIKLAAAKDLPKTGEKKDFVAFGEGDDALKILLSNVSGKVYATSAKCTHYGAPLANGILTQEGRLVCPWHAAAFCAKTGDIEDAPALDSLLTFPVEIDEQSGDLYVEADPEKLKGKPGKPITCSGAVKDGGTGLVIVGGGSAAIHLVESARKSGFAGRITMLTAEPYAPMDRTKLSKGLVGDASAVIWRSPSHLQKVLKVDLRQSAPVQSVSVQDSSVKLESGESVPFDYLVLATGGIPKRLPVPGAKEGELKNVHVLRGVDHVVGILAALGDKQDKDVVVIGSSFIGMEAAMAMAGQKKAKSVSVVGMEGVPLENVLGAEIGKGIQAAQEKNNGIKFYMKAGVQSLEGGSGGSVSAVRIKDSQGQEVSLKADVVLLGVGVGPATEYLKNSKGFPELQKDGSVLVDSAMRVANLSTGGANIFAAGDIATFPSLDGTSTIRIEHWNVAGNQGRAIGETVAALERGDASAGRRFDTRPTFWSSVGGLRWASDGNPGKYDATHIDGDPSEMKFVAYYGRSGKVAAVASMGRDPIMVHSSELMKIGKMPSLDEIKGGKDPLKVSLVQ